MAVTYVAQDISSLTSSQSCSTGTPGLELAKNALVVFNNLGVNVSKTGAEIKSFRSMTPPKLGFLRPNKVFGVKKSF